MVEIALSVLMACIASISGHDANETYFLDDYFSRSPQDTASWSKALNTISFHRNMMNEYLCRNYLANEIVESLKNRSIDKKLGRPAEDVILVSESMLKDSGSRKYKDWLSRSTTLEDIYRHYEDEENDHSADHEENTGGDVTGYALVGGKNYGYGYGFGSTGGYYQNYDHYEAYEPEDKGLKLKEIFDLSLTAIAFLAFGTFITEVMICAFGAQNPEVQMMVVSPMPSVNGLLFKSEREDATSLKAKQKSLFIEDIPNKILNEISSRVLSTIEALTIAPLDGGSCLKTVLCESNKYSRDLSGVKKIWLPLWSFGASWIAGRLVKSTDYSLLENLKASLFGFNNANCVKLYGKCDSKVREKNQ